MCLLIVRIVILNPGGGGRGPPPGTEHWYCGPRCKGRLLKNSLHFHVAKWYDHIQMQEVHGRCLSHEPMMCFNGSSTHKFPIVQWQSIQTSDLKVIHTSLANFWNTVQLCIFFKCGCCSIKSYVYPIVTYHRHHLLNGKI